MEKGNNHKRDKHNAIKELAFKYRKECPLTIKRSVDYTVNKIYNSTAPKFYIDLDNAKKYLMRIKNKKELNIKNELKIRMYHDLYTIFINYLNDGMSITDATKAAINSPAPSFYITKNTIKEILYI